MFLSDFNAEDFVGKTSLPIFKDDGQGQPAWDAMEPDAFKHDTFVYSKTGERLLFWDATENSIFDDSWKTDMRAVIEENQ